QDLLFAIDIAEALLARFEDTQSGGFFFTSHDHESLIQRPKAPHDNAIPSGNGIAAFALQRLGHLLGAARYLQAAERTLHAFSGDMTANPAACPSLLCALQEWLAPPTIVILRGESAPMAEWKRLLDSRLLPYCLIIAVPAGAGSGFPMLDKIFEGPVNAYVCRGVECLPAINKSDELVSLILR
ncbi:MAG TPA: thioredoxin domain-containing protein, partial [Novimethylophilus sp.]